MRFDASRSVRGTFGAPSTNKEISDLTLLASHPLTPLPHPSVTSLGSYRLSHDSQAIEGIKSGVRLAFLLDFRALSLSFLHGLAVRQRQVPPPVLLRRLDLSSRLSPRLYPPAQNGRTTPTSTCRTRLGPACRLALSSLRMGCEMDVMMYFRYANEQRGDSRTNGDDTWTVREGTQSEWRGRNDNKAKNCSERKTIYRVK